MNTVIIKRDGQWEVRATNLTQKAVAAVQAECADLESIVLPTDYEEEIDDFIGLLMQQRVEEWTSVATPPAMTREFGRMRKKSRRLLVISSSASQQVAYATREESEPGESEYPVKWTSACSEEWDITQDVLYWRDLPIVGRLPGVTLNPYYL